jgi:hypothetical protein
MDLFNNIFSQILGNLGGAATGGQPTSIIDQLIQPSEAQGFNPFGDILGLASGLVGGPMSKQGTLSSLPGELLRGVENVIAGDDLIGDTLGLAKPIESLGLKGLSGTSNLLGGFNPFGSGGGGGMSAILPFLLGVGGEYLQDMYGNNE